MICLHPLVQRESMMNFLSGDTSLDAPSSSEPNPCPNLLIRSGNRILLRNTSLPISETNPLTFQSLDEYEEYYKTQRANGYQCPVLFLQEETNTQGQNVYRIRPSPFDLNGGIPTQTVSSDPLSSMLQSTPLSIAQIKNYSGFDPYGQNIGKYTNVDRVHDITAKTMISDNPMDPNWGGVAFSQSAVESGKYVDNEVSKPRMIPRVIEIYK